MRNGLLFCLMLVSLKLLVKGDFGLRSKNGFEVDICNLQKKKGSCDEKIVRYYYSPGTTSCTNFTYTGCGGNLNNFATLQECKNNCPGKVIQIRQRLQCFDEPDEGECTDQIPSFYFDWRIGTCIEFSYSGCQGNNNRFKSLHSCNQECRIYRFRIGKN